MPWKRPPLTTSSSGGASMWRIPPPAVIHRVSPTVTAGMAFLLGCPCQHWLNVQSSRHRSELDALVGPRLGVAARGGLLETSGVLARLALEEEPAFEAKPLVEREAQALHHG